jgi:hypothetical protein
LKEVTGGVEYTLTHENMPAGTKTTKQMNQGGAMIVKNLKAIIERGRPPFSTRLLYRMFRLMEPLMPKKCRSENWPLDRKV